MLKNVVKEEKTGAGEQKDVIEECADSIWQLENALKKGCLLYPMPVGEAWCYLNKIADSEAACPVLLQLF